jgi:hypothetical protein
MFRIVDTCVPYTSQHIVGISGRVTHLDEEKLSVVRKDVFSSGTQEQEIDWGI